jgi:hypothetical protein
MTQLLRIATFIFTLLFVTIVNAQTGNQQITFPVQPVLHQITFNMTSEQWVTTQHADVFVGVDATLDKTQLATAHNDILQKLNKLAKTDWHITQFNRSQNSSGLEQLSVVAQARLPETALAKIRDDARNLTHPGEAYTVLNIAFTPSTAELEAVRAQLRSNLYDRIQNELNNINKIYSNQKYVVHQIDFSESGSPQPPVPMIKMAMVAGNAAEMAPSAPQLTVANKLVMTASVTLAEVVSP